MKKILLFFVSITFLSTMVIFYVFQNVRLIQTSYRIQKKEAKIVNLSDHHKRLNFELDTLHSPMQLEAKLIQSAIKLVHPTDIKIIYNQIAFNPTFLAQNSSNKNFKILGGLDFISEAHANNTQQ